MSQLDLSHQFLIAMPGMADAAFDKSLIYICEHNAQGALGIMVNRPINLTLGDLFMQIKMPLNQSALTDLPVHFGGRPCAMEASVPTCSATSTGFQSGRRKRHPAGLSPHSASRRAVIGTFW